MNAPRPNLVPRSQCTGWRALAPLALAAGVCVSAPARADVLETNELWFGREATAISRISLMGAFNQLKTADVASTGASGGSATSLVTKNDFLFVLDAAYAMDDGPTLELRLPVTSRGGDGGSTLVGNVTLGARKGYAFDLGAGASIAAGAHLILPTAKEQDVRVMADRFWTPELTRRALALMPNLAFGVDAEFVTVSAFADLIAGFSGVGDDKSDGGNQRYFAWRAGASATASLVDFLAVVVEATATNPITKDGGSPPTLISVIPGVRLKISALSIGLGARMAINKDSSYEKALGGVADITFAFQ